MTSVIDFYKSHYQEILNQEPWKSWIQHNDRIIEEYGFSSVRLYSKTFDQIINVGLRTGRLSETGFIIFRRIINMLNRAQRIPTDLFLFRGIKDVPSINIKGLKTGDTFTIL